MFSEFTIWIRLKHACKIVFILLCIVCSAMAQSENVCVPDDKTNEWKWTVNRYARAAKRLKNIQSHHTFTHTAAHKQWMYLL